ncbi:MAG: hypothetical protein M3Y81_13050 [Chloroflexota bacterium]|nr:hypothetical protein [Chloroflexota bacterium]
MEFCGHCGYLLPPDRTTCPRCGRPVEMGQQREDAHLYDATIASAWSLPAKAPDAMPLPEQQKLVLHPDDSEYGYGAGGQIASDPTNRVDARSYVPPNPPTPNVSTPYPGFIQPGSIGYAPVSGQFETEPGRRGGRGRAGLLVFILLILLLLLASAVTLTLQYTGVINLPLPLPRPPVVSTPPPNLTPSQQAQAVIQQYYADINHKDYQGAYNLWWHSSFSYATFANGYAHTQHDDITIDSQTPLPDGTVQVNITINATEDGPTGASPVHSVYQGSYVIGQEGSAWKFLSGTFHKVG